MEMTLKHLRLLREKSQEECAKTLNIHVQTYRKLEENPDDITIGQAKKLSAFLQIPYDDIVFLPIKSTFSRE